jgi:hypothetical protein
MRGEKHDQNMLVMETIIYVASNTAKKAVFCFLRGREEISGLQYAIQVYYVL